MFKYIGIFVIVLSSSLIGFSCSDKLRKRAKELGMIHHMLDEISILIRYKAMTVYEIIKTLKENQMFNNLPLLINFKINEQEPFSVSWDKQLESMHTDLKEGDIKLLKSFGNSLGTSDIDGQLQTIEVYKNDFKKLEADALSIYDKKARLYRSLGLLCGMFISIMLI
jgi:stage III sporulation protein AB